MPLESVVVHSVDQLEAFRDVLLRQLEALESAYDTLNAACIGQEENWSDPQYTYLRECMDAYYQHSKLQLTQLEASASYITELIGKLRAI